MTLLFLVFSRPKRKKKLPPGKKPLKKGPSGSHKKKGVSFLEEAAAAADAGETLPSSETPRPAAVRPSAEEKEDGETEEGEKSLRKSTRTSVVVKQAEREAQRAIQQALPKVESALITFNWSSCWMAMISLSFVCFPACFHENMHSIYYTDYLV